MVDIFRSNVANPTSFIASTITSLLAIITNKKITMNRTVDAIRMGLSICKAKLIFFLRIIMPMDIGIIVINKI